MKTNIETLLFVLFLMLSFTAAQTQGIKEKEREDKAPQSQTKSYKKGKLLYKEDFNNGLDNWVIEAPQNQDSKVIIEEGKLIVDVNEGTTVWFDQRLSGNYMIEYKRKVIMEGGKNDRLSDLNNFWMATDPRNENLFTRSGLFSEYDSLLMYYVGVGGNYNSTSRFRKYTGDGERVLYSDLQDQEYLLEPNKEYEVKIIVYDGVTKFFLDGKEFFSFKDPAPLKEGYFGFRTTKSRHEIDEFRVYGLK